MSKQVIGIEKRTTKSDKQYIMLHTMDLEEKEGLSGHTVSTEYVSMDKFPNELKVGDIVNFYFDKGYQDKAFLNFIDIIKK